MYMKFTISPAQQVKNLIENCGRVHTFFKLGPLTTPTERRSGVSSPVPSSAHINKGRPAPVVDEGRPKESLCEAICAEVVPEGIPACHNTPLNFLSY